MKKKFLVLSGGVGGSKLVAGLAQVLSPEEMLVLVNTGDDFDHLGLRICPDIDTVSYRLAGLVNLTQGWGRRDESWAVMDALDALGDETWFRLGDRDIALHLLRAKLLHSGYSLSDATREILQRLGVGVELLPMCDQTVETWIDSDEGLLPFQQYFVKRRCQPRVRGISYQGVQHAGIAERVSTLIRQQAFSGVIVTPSNPFLSIGPILAIPGLKSLIREAKLPVIAVSPFIGGAAVKGPAAKIQKELGYSDGNDGLLEFYDGWLDSLIIHESDIAPLTAETSIIESNILMPDDAAAGRLAQIVVEAF